MRPKVLFYASVVLVFAGTVAGAADKDKPRTIHLKVDLTDGSRLIGTAEKFESFPFHVQKRETIRWNSVWKINTNKDGETSTIQFRDGSTRSGVIDRAAFTMKTNLGVLRVPFPLVKSVACRIEGLPDPKITVCNPNGSTLVGQVPAGKTVRVRVWGQWRPGSNWPYVGPTGSKATQFAGNNKWCVLLILQDKAGKPVRTIASTGKPVSITADKKSSLSILLRMNDDVFGDNQHKPGDPMRCMVISN